MHGSRMSTSSAGPRSQQPPNSRQTTPATSTSRAPVPSHLRPEASQSSSRVGKLSMIPTPTPAATPLSSAQADLSNARNDKATTALIRRVLCAQASGHASEQRASPQPLEELLPPLTSSNEVDLQLYALLAIVVKEFVYSWYSRITPDYVFTEELIQVVAHCSRAIEQRIRRIDVDALLLDEIPALIEAHILAYRTALQSSLVDSSQTRIRSVYHTLHPHRALSPVPDMDDPVTISTQQENETAYRQLLAKGLLVVLLPSEDLENVCLRSLVGDLLADLLLGQIVSGTVCEGWFMWETVTKLVSGSNAGEVERRPRDLPQEFGLGSATGQRYRNENDLPDKGQSRLVAWVWRILQFWCQTYIALRYIFIGLLRVASTPSTFSAVRGGSVSSSSPVFPVNFAKETPMLSERNIAKLPVVKYRIFGLIAQIIDVPTRMPWLGGLLALLQYQLLSGPAKLGEAGSVMDRFLRQMIQNSLLTPKLLPTLLISIRATLFPSNARPGSAAPQTQSSGPNVTIDSTSLPIPDLNGGRAPSPLSTALQQPRKSTRPSASQVQAIKHACATSIASLIPHQVALALFRFPIQPGGKPSGACATPQGASAESQPRPTNASIPLTEPLTSSLVSNATAAGKLGAKSQTGPERYVNPSASKGTAASQQQPAGNSLHANDVNLNNNDNHTAASTTTGIVIPSLNNSGGEPEPRDDDDSCRWQQQELLLSVIERDILDLFSDSYCNRHLVFAIIEAVLVKIVPELVDHGIVDLVTERGLQMD